MSFVTRQETTWGDLREDEQIVDKTGEGWITGKPEPIGSEVRVTITGTPMGPNQDKSVVVVKPATDTVTVIRPLGDPSPDEDQATQQSVADQVIAATLPAAMERPLDEEILTGAKATVEATMGPTVEVLPVIDTALELRSHLYLLHGVMIHEATTRAALLEHHRRSELLESEGRPEAGYVPHIHEEDK